MAEPVRSYPPARSWGAVVVGIVLAAMGVLLALTLWCPRGRWNVEKEGAALRDWHEPGAGAMFLLGAAPFVICLMQGTMFGTKL